jgi:beta-galactosidase
MKYHLNLLAPLFAVMLSSCVQAQVPSTPAARQTLSFNADWRFRLGDDGYDAAAATLTNWTWKTASAEEAANPGAAVRNLNADGWPTTAIGQDIFGGKLEFAWLHATLPRRAGGTVLNFAGIDDNATVFVNGEQLGTNKGWNVPFKVDATRALNANGDNDIFVLVENTGHAGGLAGAVTVSSAQKTASGPALAEYSDASWRKLNVPHDWMIEGVKGNDPSAMDGPFDRKSPATHEGGYLNGGIGWYRKSFTPAANLQGQRAYLQFDGVYMDSDVWLNGQYLGGRPYGYSTFGFDITPFLKFGQPNTLAVRCNVTQICSRFYSGAGIYRNVWLTYTNPLHIAPQGVYVTTPQVSDASAQTRVRTTIQNDGNAVANLTLTTTITSPDGKTVATEKSTRALGAGESAELDQTLNVPNPQRWDVSAPRLYRVTTSVQNGNGTPDSVSTPFGIRTIEFTKDNGFLLNGKRLQIQGVCQHHDLGALGAAVNVRALERQLEILRSFGTNAIRTSHNPPTPELLDLCDRMGFVVMDEILDEWRHPKKPFGYGRFFDEWSERDLVSTVRRDRNHPSVIMWSHGNEIDEQGMPQGAAMSKRLADIIHREDPTRPVTSGMNNPSASSTRGFGDPLDLFGINYHHGFYNDAKTRAKWPMIASETSSASSTRGEYGLTLDANGNVVIKTHLNNQLTEYDMVAPGWGNTSEVNLKALQNAPWMAGQFVWTGFDYIGEPTPYTWPSRSSYFGIVDLAGFRKDRAWLYQSQWTSAPMVHIVPGHWNWEQFTGKEIPVWIYSNADSVELFLNDKSLGSKSFVKGGALHLEFKVPFAPGTLRAVASKDGKVVARDEIKTAGAPAAIRLIPDRSKISADGKDLSFVTVRVEDASGVLCPEAEQEITFSATGAGAVIATDNGDATNHESFQTLERKAFHGLALAIVQSTDKAGEVVLTASAPGLKSATVRIQSNK